TVIDLEKCYSEEPNNFVPDNSLATTKFQNDPAFYTGKTISPGLKLTLLELGPCQPKDIDLPGGKFPHDSSIPSRSFSMSYYTKLVNGKTENRTWLSYSPSTDKVYCWTCKLFGTPRAQKGLFASSGYHLEAELNRVMYINNNRIDLQLTKSSNTQVAANREVVKVLMDIVIYLAKHNSALRGHLESPNDNIQGQFLDWVNLFSKYHPVLRAHLDRIQSSSKKTRLSFMSKGSQNAMLECIAETIRKKILNEVKLSGMYSLILDSTTDVSKLDQFAFVLRYCTTDGTVHERLMCVDETVDSTGNGMFQLFSKICDNHALNWKKELVGQAYDGASNMQGAIKGLRTIIQNHNPNALHVWCFAHCLNLAVCDACEATAEVQDFFGTVRSLVNFLSARKRTAKYVELQKSIYPKERIRRLKHFSNTRWTYHDRCIDVMLKTYKAVIETLQFIMSDEADKKICDMAKGFYKNLNKFSFIVTAHLMKKIFSATTPLSVYLQAPDMDFIQAMKLVKATRQFLNDMRIDDNLSNIFSDSESFCTSLDLEEKNMPIKRTSIKKKMSGEKANDERLLSSKDRYISEVYNMTLDKTLMKLDDRYNNAENVFNEISLFSAEHLLLKFATTPSSFNYICKWLSSTNIDQDSLST
ncbi:zinc finger MYM-type protein 1-like, partial [Aphis craccivora]